MVATEKTLSAARGRDRRCSNTRRYEASPYGLRMISGLMLLREKVLGPLLSAALSTEISPEVPHPSKSDQHFEVIRQHMQGVFRQLGLAA